MAEEGHAGGGVSCDAVRDAYRAKGWSFGNPEDIGQCKNDRFLDKLAEQEGEGCNIYGYLEVNKVRSTPRTRRSLSACSGCAVPCEGCCLLPIWPTASEGLQVQQACKQGSCGVEARRASPT